MKRLKIIRAFFGLWLAGALLTTINAQAHAPRAREATAVVQTINHDKRTLALRYSQRRGPRELIWHSDTKFLRDWKCVSATELKDGTRATFYYHSPLFGKPFVTKVVWESGK